MSRPTRRRRRSSARQSEPGNKSLGAKSEICRVFINAPWPPLRRLYGIHRRTAGLLACGVSPAPPSRTVKSSGENAPARRLQSRGRPRIGMSLPCSLFTLGRNRGTVLGCMFQLRQGLSNGARSALTRSKATSSSKHRNKSGLHFRGQLLERFGRRTSRSKPGPQLPQRGDLGFRDDGAKARGGVFGLG